MKPSNRVMSFWTWARVLASWLCSLPKREQKRFTRLMQPISRRSQPGWPQPPAREPLHLENDPWEFYNLADEPELIGEIVDE